MENIEHLNSIIEDIEITEKDILLLFRNDQEIAPNLDIIESSIEEPDMYNKVLKIYDENITEKYSIIEGKFLLCIFKIYNSRYKKMMKENFDYLAIEILKKISSYNNILTYCPFEKDDLIGIEIFDNFINFLSKYIKITFFEHRGYNININYGKWLEEDAIKRNIINVREEISKI